MTKRELVLAAFNNERAPRAPVGFWFHFLPEERWGDGLKDAEVFNLNFAGHKDFIERYNPDFVKIMSDGFFIPPTADINNISDLRSIEPLVCKDEWIQMQVELVKKVSLLDSNMVYFYNIFSPLTTLRFMVGAEKLLSFISTDISLVGKAVYNLGITLSMLAERIVSEGGADGIYFSVQNPDIKRITDAAYAEYFSPADSLVLQASASDNNILHICGYEGVRNRLPAWRGYNAKAYNWAAHVEGVSLAEGKALFSGKAVIGGFANPKGSLIDAGGREEIESFVKKLLLDCGSRGVIIGADCTISSDIHPERFEWVRQAAVLAN
ncbi:MAG: hypothetical protein LBP51_02750 [Deferribacteraceae bacterium]|jgi:uroporphyrinogen decarboxylase|nr:hypothetical protein [Deferribacteraceae bacterium]